MRRLIRKYPIGAFYLGAVMVVSAVVAYWQIGAVFYEQINGIPLDLFGLLYRALDELGYQYPNLVASIHVFFHYPWLTPAIFFGLAPTISAVVVEALRSGTAGVGKLLRRLRPYGPSASAANIWLCYAVITLGAVALIGVFLAVQSTSGDEAENQRVLEILGWPSIGAMIVAFALAAFLDEGGLLEELGWRGFALPLLLTRMSALKASVAIGLLWASWHLPREVALLFGGDGVFAAFLLKQVDFFSSAVAVSIVITWFFHLSGGSVVPAIMIHGLANFFSKTFYFDGMPVMLGTFRFQTIVEILLALTLIFLTRKQLGEIHCGVSRSISRAEADGTTNSPTD